MNRQEGAEHEAENQCAFDRHRSACGTCDTDLYDLCILQSFSEAGTQGFTGSGAGAW